MTPNHTLGKVRHVLTKLSWIEWAPEGASAIDRQRYIDAARARALDRIESLVGECDAEVSA